MAYLQSSPLAGEPMRSTWLTLDTLLDQCEAVFGVLPDTSGINAKFGGDWPFASNVFYTNFKDDPWVEAGIDRAAFGEDASCFADCGSGLAPIAFLIFRFSQFTITITKVTKLQYTNRNQK